MVAPSENGIWRGSDCPLEPPQRRGRWPDPLPSSGTLGWWRLSSATRCKETRSLAEQPADRCSAPPSRPGGVPSPSWDILLHPRGLELVLPSLRQEVVDGVLQLNLVAMAPRSDGMPGGVSHIITDRCSEGWPLVRVEDPEP
jgi:hypothetical protein